MTDISSDAISTKNIKENLMNLRQIFPGEDENVYIFADFLASRFGNSDLNPQGFYLTVHISLKDLQKGIDGYSGNPIRNNLVDLPPEIYSFLLAIFIDNIIDKICPEEFAEKVKNVHQEIKNIDF